jgi:hypothetical protein
MAGTDLCCFDLLVPAMNTPLLPATALVLLLCSNPVFADDAALQRCRSMPDATPRLACYDALPLVNAANATTTSTATTTAAANTVSTLSTKQAPPPPTAAATTVSTTSLRPASTEAGFGLEQQRDQQVTKIVSRIVGALDGWGPRTQFRLENGQVWQVTDDSSAVYNLKSPGVKIERAVLGGFEMEIEGAKRAPRVKRLE